MTDQSPPATDHHGAPRDPHSFDDSYASSTPPPWDIGRPQPAFERLVRSGALTGKVLDVGCGTGEHALLAAACGHEAVGVDSARRAVELAQAKAVARALAARFVVGDALDLMGELGERFDTVLDCGLFHVFDDHDRARFVESLATAIPAGGRYHMLCFSERQPGDWGPRRVTEAEIRESFDQGWHVDAVEPTVIEITINPDGAQAWMSAITRI